LPRRSFTRAALAISPQCGFASTVAGNPLSEAGERLKLKLCVQTAQAAWT
jgi:5-methyltetrahydropteroyltriglutamate--homocysteine methyltransferase